MVMGALVGIFGLLSIVIESILVTGLRALWIWDCDLAGVESPPGSQTATSPDQSELRNLHKRHETTRDAEECILVFVASILDSSDLKGFIEGVLEI